jgi:hypothetical protein
VRSRGIAAAEVMQHAESGAADVQRVQHDQVPSVHILVRVSLSPSSSALRGTHGRLIRHGCLPRRSRRVKNISSW